MKDVMLYLMNKNFFNGSFPITRCRLVVDGDPWQWAKDKLWAMKSVDDSEDVGPVAMIDLFPPTEPSDLYDNKVSASEDFKEI